jgi:hypothetical protein
MMGQGNFYGFYGRNLFDRPVRCTRCSQPFHQVRPACEGPHRQVHKRCGRCGVGHYTVWIPLGEVPATERLWDAYIDNRRNRA